MIELLLVSNNSDLLDAIGVLLAPRERYRCHRKADTDSAMHLLQMPLFDVCLIDADLTDVGPIRQIQEVRQANSKILLIVLSAKVDKEWEEEAYLNGADFIVTKPLRGRLLNNLFNKIFPLDVPAPDSSRTNEADRPAAAQHTGSQPAPAGAPPLPALEILRDFSRIFSFTLNLKSFAYQFALKLREIISVNRIAIFLEQGPSTPFSVETDKRSKRLKCLCSVGIEPELFDFLTLSNHSGIGQAVLKTGRILRSQTAPADSLLPLDPQVQREFELLGGQIAIPILDRERAIGVAVLGERLTGQAFSNEELQLLFHLMEELGIAIKSNLLHNQLLSSHQLISGIFSQMSAGCLVVDHELNILHANPALSRLLDLPTPIEFANLPRELAGPLYESTQYESAHEPFIYRDESRPDRCFRVSIIPFKGENDAAGAMMSVEDFTVVEAARQADLESSTLRLIALIAERFAHEIRNALLPIETCRQLIPENRGDAEFSRTLERTLEQEGRRISRLTDQLLYLSKQDLSLSETKSLASLLQEAFSLLKPLVPGNAELKCGDQLSRYQVQCHSASLVHAFFEVLLNGFQSNPDSPLVTVSGEIEPGSNGTAFFKLNFRDQGAGLTPDLSVKAMEPFFTTRNVGVGLGLSVTRKIVEDHHGRLSLNDSGPTGPGNISISLPVSPKPD